MGSLSRLGGNALAVGVDIFERGHGLTSKYYFPSTSLILLASCLSVNGEEVERAFGAIVVDKYILCIARNENDFYIRELRKDFINHGGAVHAGHDDVGDDQIDLVAMLLHLRDAHIAAIGFQYGIAFIGEGAGGKNAHWRFIFHQQNGSCARQINGGAFSCASTSLTAAAASLCSTMGKKIA